MRPGRHRRGGHRMAASSRRERGHDPSGVSLRNNGAGSGSEVYLDPKTVTLSAWRIALQDLVRPFQRLPRFSTHTLLYNRGPDMRVSAHRRVLELTLLAACWSLHGAQLPLRHYSTADGLANNAVYSIASDSRGFLWFATAEGLSRFDGYGFANQTVSTGLPHSTVRQVLIGRHGNYWLATPAGLVRFRPDLPQSSANRMVVIRPNSKPESAPITALLEDRGGKQYTALFDGSVWTTPPNVVAAGGRGRLLKLQLVSKRKSGLAGPPIHTHSHRACKRKRKLARERINHDPSRHVAQLVRSNP
jgi:hypothetical protein